MLRPMRPHRTMRPPRAAALILLLLASPAFASEPDSASADLGPTSEVPWNPPKALSPNEPWEAVARFPGRVVSLPLAALGQGVRVSMRAAEQGFVIQKTLALFGDVQLPIAVGPAELGERTGIGVGAGTRLPAGPLRFPIGFEMSADQYTRFRAGVEAGPASLHYRSELRPRDRFFGFGMGARDEDESVYGLREQRVELAIRQASDLLGARGPRQSFEIWAGPRWTRLTRGFGTDDPSVVEAFPGAISNVLDREQEHFTYGMRLGVDQTGGRPHWTRGWRARFSGERFDRPLAASPSRAGAQFNRWQLEAEAGTSFRRDPRTLRLAVGIVNQQVTGGADRFLLADLARLGGARGLAGYEPQRFHDLDRVNARLSWIFPLSALFEFDVHGDTGGVFSRLAEDFRLDRLRQSAGFALRGRTTTTVVAMFGMDASPEGMRVVFSLGSEP